jgi:hypothetical protein
MHIYMKLSISTFILFFSLNVFNVLFVGYSLAENKLNNTYQYNMISKKISKTMNYLIILIKFKVSRFLCRSVYIVTQDSRTRGFRTRRASEERVGSSKTRLVKRV